MIKVNKSYHISKEDDGEAEYCLYHTKPLDRELIQKAIFIGVYHGEIYNG